MKITRYEPLSVLNQMNSLLEDMFRNERDSSNVATSQWIPAVDIKEEKDRFVIEADLPGVSKDAIEIAMANNILTLKGERNDEKKAEANNWSRIERIRGSFYRQFTLPETADSDNIRAYSENGVLVISVPKKEMAKPKRISIEDKVSNSRSFTDKLSKVFNKETENA